MIFGGSGGKNNKTVAVDRAKREVLSENLRSELHLK